MSKLLDGKTALITGAASGIGRASALLFAREGASVIIADQNESALVETTNELDAIGARYLPVILDLTDEDSVARMIETGVQKFGRLDVAHNNAGITEEAQPFHEISKSSWDRMIAINLTSVFLCMKHELRVMVQQGSGAIVNTSSGAGIIGAAGIPHYVAAKHGVLGLTKTAALEYLKLGIRVNAILPGNTDTPMMERFVKNDPDLAIRMRSSTRTGEFGRPSDIAEAAVWLCSDRARWVSGESMLVDGGSICR